MSAFASISQTLRSSELLFLNQTPESPVQPKPEVSKSSESFDAAVAAFLSLARLFVRSSGPQSVVARPTARSANPEIQKLSLGTILFNLNPSFHSVTVDFDSSGRKILVLDPQPQTGLAGYTIFPQRPNAARQAQPNASGSIELSSLKSWALPQEGEVPVTPESFAKLKSGATLFGRSGETKYVTVVETHDGRKVLAVAPSPNGDSLYFVESRNGG